MAIACLSASFPPLSMHNAVTVLPMFFLAEPRALTAYLETVETTGVPHDLALSALTLAPSQHLLYRRLFSRASPTLYFVLPPFFPFMHRTQYGQVSAAMRIIVVCHYHQNSPP